MRPDQTIEPSATKAENAEDDNADDDNNNNNNKPKRDDDNDDDSNEKNETNRVHDTNKTKVQERRAIT